MTMSSQPALRIYREAPLEAAVEPASGGRGSVSAPHPLLAVVFSAAIHAIVLLSASAMAILAVTNGISAWPGVPDHPLHTVFVALVLAQCGIGSVFFARSSWPLTFKLVLGSMFVACLWLLLVRTMESTKQTPIAAGAWAVCLLGEAIGVWTVVALIELVIHREAAAARARFSILHVLIGTTAVAALLGGGRVFGTRYGFTLADVPEWSFFWHVQFAAITNTVLTIALYASVRLPNSATARASYCGTALALTAFAAPLLFLAVFEQNTSLTEMRWLFASEGLFLIATLRPMEILRNGNYLAE